MQILQSLMMTALVLALTMTPARAAENVYEHALRNAKVGHAGFGLRVTKQASTAVVQTYQDPNAPTPRDMKIDAVLMAKVLCQSFSDVAKVRVQYYKSDSTSYFETDVTAAEITAFGSGSVSKDRLLDGMELSLHQVSTANVAAAVKLDKKFQTTGISFSYPSSWRFQESSEPTCLAQFELPNSFNWALVSLRYQTTESLETQVEHDSKYAVAMRVQVDAKRPVTLANGTIRGVELVVQTDDDANAGTKRIHRRIYFGRAGRIFCLTLVSLPADAAKYTPEFLQVLNSVRLL